MPEGKKTFKERWAEASADADRARAEKAERKAEAEAEQHAGLEATCVYRGSTQPAEQLKLGARYKLRLDRDGISLRAWRQEVLGIEWGTVLDVGILDQSGTHIKTQIVRKASGGFGSPLGTTAPVAKTSSRHFSQCEVTVNTTHGDWLLTVLVSPTVLRGKLMISRHQWAAAPEVGPADGGAANGAAPPDPDPDPAARLARLVELHSAGLITDEDLQAKKAQILAEL